MSGSSGPEQVRVMRCACPPFHLCACKQEAFEAAVGGFQWQVGQYDVAVEQADPHAVGRARRRRVHLSLTLAESAGGPSGAGLYVKPEAGAVKSTEGGKGAKAAGPKSGFQK